MDGLIEEKTIAAIKKFQSGNLGFKYPDGRVDPGGQTLAALNGPLKWAQKPATADDDDTTGDDSATNKSTKWGLLLLKGHTDFHWVFELLNVESQRAHRLAFTGVGHCILEYDLELQEIARWVESGRYVRFDLKTPADFEDFQKIAKIQPRNLGLSRDHILKIAEKPPIPLPIRPNELPVHHPWTSLGRNRIDLFGFCKVEYGNGQPSRPLIWWH